MADVTIIWEKEGVSVSPGVDLDLGTITSLPGSITPVEMRLYYSAAPEITKLKDCSFSLSAYSRVYPNPLQSNATTDLEYLGRWGAIDTSLPTGVHINLNKANNYPSASWQTFKPGQGWTIWNGIPVVKEAVRLPGGSYHDTDGEVPVEASVYFLIRIGAPLGVVRVGDFYFSLVFNFTPVYST